MDGPLFARPNMHTISWVTVIWFIFRRWVEIENTFRDLATFGLCTQGRRNRRLLKISALTTQGRIQVINFQIVPIVHPFTTDILQSTPGVWNFCSNYLIKW